MIESGKHAVADHQTSSTAVGSGRYSVLVTSAGSSSAFPIEARAGKYK